MKKVILFALLLVISITFVGSCQPNTSSVYEVGIVNPLAGKSYIYFTDVKIDSLSSVLVSNMDYLSPNVSGNIRTLSNFRTVGDTLFGDFTIADVAFQRFIKHGLVQKDNVTGKYSGMTVTFWGKLDVLEKNPAFFIRKKN